MSNYLSNLALRGAGLTASMLTSQPRLDHSFEPLSTITSTAQDTPDLTPADNVNPPDQPTNQSNREETPPIPNTLNPPTTDVQTPLKQYNQPKPESKIAIKKREHTIIQPTDPQSHLSSQVTPQISHHPQIHVPELTSEENSISPTSVPHPEAPNSVVPDETEPNLEFEAASLIAPRPTRSAGRGESFASRQRERSIHVHIDTIEVVAVTPPPPQPVKELSANRPLLSLDEYLKRRNEGKI